MKDEIKPSALTLHPSSLLPMAVIKANNLPKGSAAFSMADIEQHARAILARAKAQADQLLAEAQQQAAQLKANAVKEGKAAGLEQGKKEGRDQAIAQAKTQALTEQKAKIAETVAVITKAAKELDARIASVEQDARVELVPLALTIARRVSRIQSKTNPAVVEANVSEAVRLVMNKSSLRIAVHPTQREAIQTLLPQLKLQWPTMQHVELVDDPKLATGGCRVFSAGGVIDADLDTQLDRIATELACDPEAKTE